VQPIAFALYAAQSAWFAMTDEIILGRGPAHALFVGFFSSLLVAMVTRATRGHSGRLLVLGPFAGFAFIVVQMVGRRNVPVAKSSRAQRLSICAARSTA
jgi:uncharacterized protein involved in response to NO